MKKIVCVCCVVLILLLGGILYGAGVGGKIQIFLNNYIAYVKSDIGNQADLFKSIIGGLCSGGVTFGALFITILHENKKDRLFWKKEKQKDREQRLLSIRPFLNIEIKSISVLRTGRCMEQTDFVLVGQGNMFQLVDVILSNQGYGKCKKIRIDNHECSISQLDKEQEEELEICFKGLEERVDEQSFEIIFIYDDIFGNSYLQQFKCYLRSKTKELDIEIGEPLLRKEEE